MTTFYDYVVEAASRRDDIVEAEKERLARQVSKPGRWMPGLWQRWLVRLGERLVVWGCRLQARYAHALEVSGALQAEPAVKEGNPGAGAG
jgi:hypothetical protein